MSAREVPQTNDPLGRLDAAVASLRRGGLVCIPTETTYGIAADIASAPALAALTSLKTRDARSPLALIAADIAQARALARVWPRAADELAARHWPGPLTLVVPARPDLHPSLVGPGGGVGVRVSSHPVPVALARALGRPVTATSANPGGAPPALTVGQARAYFGDAIACYLDAGPAARQAASTVVAIAPDGAITVCRPGPVAVTSDVAREPGVDPG